jgi:DNA-binding GntR family transcriptional regulator
LEPAYLTKAQFAATALRAIIRGGELAPGERLDLEALGKRLNMSATPIREALRILEAEGLVVSEPHHGIRVADFSTDDASALYDLRALLESFATELVAADLDSADITELERLQALHREALGNGDTATANGFNEEWHFRIYRRAGESSPYLLEFISRLWNAFPWTTAWMVPGRDARSKQDHAEILDAIKAADGALAGELMRGHILAGKDFVLQHLENTAGSSSSERRRASGG